MQKANTLKSCIVLFLIAMIIFQVPSSGLSKVNSHTRNLESEIHSFNTFQSLGNNYQVSSRAVSESTGSASISSIPGEIDIVDAVSSQILSSLSNESPMFSAYNNSIIGISHPPLPASFKANSASSNDATSLQVIAINSSSNNKLGIIAEYMCYEVNSSKNMSFNTDVSSGNLIVYISTGYTQVANGFCTDQPVKINGQSPTGLNGTSIQIYGSVWSSICSAVYPVNSTGSYNIYATYSSTDGAITSYVLVIGQVTNNYSTSFYETGLPVGTTWYVNLSNGQSFSSNASSMSFSESNGTYAYAIATTNKSYAPSPSTGSFTINGSPVSENAEFSNISGAEKRITLNVTLNGSVYMENFELNKTLYSRLYNSDKNLETAAATYLANFTSQPSVYEIYSTSIYQNGALVNNKTLLDSIYFNSLNWAVSIADAKWLSLNFGRSSSGYTSLTQWISTENVQSLGYWLAQGLSYATMVGPLNSLVGSILSKGSLSYVDLLTSIIWDSIQGYSKLSDCFGATRATSILNIFEQYGLVSGTSYRGSQFVYSLAHLNADQYENFVQSIMSSQGNSNAPPGTRAIATNFIEHLGGTFLEYGSTASVSATQSFLSAYFGDQLTLATSSEISFSGAIQSVSDSIGEGIDDGSLPLALAGAITAAYIMPYANLLHQEILDQNILYQVVYPALFQYTANLANGTTPEIGTGTGVIDLIGLVDILWWQFFSTQKSISGLQLFNRAQISSDSSIASSFLNGSIGIYNSESVIGAEASDLASGTAQTSSTSIIRSFTAPSFTFEPSAIAMVISLEIDITTKYVTEAYNYTKNVLTSAGTTIENAISNVSDYLENGWNSLTSWVSLTDPAYPQMYVSGMEVYTSLTALNITYPFATFALGSNYSDLILGGYAQGIISVEYNENTTMYVYGFNSSSNSFSAAYSSSIHNNQILALSSSYNGVNESVREDGYNVSILFDRAANETFPVTVKIYSSSNTLLMSINTKLDALQIIGLPNGTYSYQAYSSNKTIGLEPVSGSFAINGGNASLTIILGPSGNQYSASSLVSQIEFYALIGVSGVAIIGVAFYFRKKSRQ